MAGIGRSRRRKRKRIKINANMIKHSRRKGGVATVIRHVKPSPRVQSGGAFIMKEEKTSTQLLRVTAPFDSIQVQLQLQAPPSSTVPQVLEFGVGTDERYEGSSLMKTKKKHTHVGEEETWKRTGRERGKEGAAGSIMEKIDIFSFLLLSFHLHE